MPSPANTIASSPSSTTTSTTTNQSPPLSPPPPPPPPPPATPSITTAAVNSTSRNFQRRLAWKRRSRREKDEKDVDETKTRGEECRRNRRETERGILSIFSEEFVIFTAWASSRMP
ncbi:hypothetical protein E2C01_096913 [Portunus trituberculatus]|uniref:Uncharacterized protein n=1 Tax=Portunus trituberculatus TaxID=210409 RepID=A0A5B7K842_PORTR|nr:hypothetical protein [Portunus trituberculatus]